MEFTLRQARSLESRLRSLTIENQVLSVRAYDGDVARTDILEGIEALKNEIDSKINLNAIRHLIKHLINGRNMECGISKLLNTRDELYSNRDLLNTLSDADDVERQVEYAIAHPAKSRMVCVVVEDIAEEVALDLTDIDYELNEISRELNELNNSITISLDDGDTIFLQENNLI